MNVFKIVLIMQAKKRFALLWLVILFIFAVCLLKTAKNPNTLLRLTYNVDNVEDLPSYTDDWQPSSEIGRPPAAKTYKARQQMPFHTSYRKTNKNCRFVDRNKHLSIHKNCDECLTNF